MSKYLHQYWGPKPMTRVDINDNNQSSNNTSYPTFPILHIFPLVHGLIIPSMKSVEVTQPPPKYSKPHCMGTTYNSRLFSFTTSSHQSIKNSLHFFCLIVYLLSSRRPKLPRSNYGSWGVTLISLVELVYWFPFFRRSNDLSMLQESMEFNV
jgi:hypothetical protein